MGMKTNTYKYLYFASMGIKTNTYKYLYFAINKLDFIYKNKCYLAILT
jgi:hypothetical protein